MADVPRCPESMFGAHGPADTAGRCPWCKQPYKPPAQRPPAEGRSQLTLAYEEHYDPDWGGRTPALDGGT